MGKIFCVMGKSASGKDTIYNKILQEDSLGLNRIIPYTTRPIRDGETPGADYNFCTEEDVLRLTEKGQIIELREYNTVYGVWKYFTVNDGNIDLDKKNYLTVGTLESFVKIRDCFGSGKVLPIYIEVEDGDRLIRAINREKQQQVPKYEEMCSRFLADSADFSEEKIVESGIKRRFVNDALERCLEEIKRSIKETLRN